MEWMWCLTYGMFFILRLPPFALKKILQAVSIYLRVRFKAILRLCYRSLYRTSLEWSDRILARFSHPS